MKISTDIQDLDAHLLSLERSYATVTEKQVGESKNLKQKFHKNTMKMHKAKLFAEQWPGNPWSSNISNGDFGPPVARGCRDLGCATGGRERWGKPFRARSPHYNPSPLSNSFDPFLWIISALGQMQGLTTGIFKMQMIRDMDLLPPELLFWSTHVKSSHQFCPQQITVAMKFCVFKFETWVLPICQSASFSYFNLSFTNKSDSEHIKNIKILTGQSISSIMGTGS